MRGLWLAGLVAALVVGACSGGAVPTPQGTPAVTVELSAYNSAFEQTSLTIPAGVSYAIEFNNKDSVPHNVNIAGGPAGSKTDIFSGPDERVFVLPALPVGTYTFHCDVHPNMTGTITAT